MNGGCHCGAVTIRVPDRPDYLNACNCSVCTKLGTLWGYYPRNEVVIDGAPATYRRSDAATPRLAFGFCATCGAATHWAPLADDAADIMGVNMRLFEPDELRGLEVRYGDRRRHARSEPRRYYRAPTTFDGLGAVA